MQKVLILGSGMVAQPIIRYLLSKNYLVTVASNTPDRTAVMIGGNPNGTGIFWEATDEGTLDSLIASHDLTVSLLPYVFHPKVAALCVKNRKNMVTTSYVKPEMQSLDASAREAGVILLNELGLDPGIDHMSAMRIIDHIHEKEGAVMEFYSICGALPAPEAANNPFRYKFSWSPKGVVMAGNNDALYLKHGREVSLPTARLFKDPSKVDFPGVGELEFYPNRDSLAYREIYGIPEANTVFRGTFRFPGWCETLDAMKRIGLTSYDKFNMTGMSYAGMVKHLVEQKTGVAAGQDAIGLVAGFLGVNENAYAINAMSWLGLFSENLMNRGEDSPFEVTSDLMLEKMMLGADERDMVVLQHTFLAGYSDGRKEVIRSRMLDYGVPGGDTAIARTVALPAAIGAEMILSGKITAKGVHIPVIPEIYNPILDQLEKMDIRMVEEYGLPLADNIQ
jgi:saccharopine dehydrogenase (NADP+, L-glutamate forming)